MDVVAFKGRLFKQVVSRLCETTAGMYKVDVVALTGTLFKQVVCETTADMYKVDVVALKGRLFKQVVCETTADMYKVDGVAFKGRLFKQVVSHFCKSTADVCKVNITGLQIGTFPTGGQSFLQNNS